MVTYMVTYHIRERELSDFDNIDVKYFVIYLETELHVYDDVT